MKDIIMYVIREIKLITFIIHLSGVACPINHTICNMTAMPKRKAITLTQ